MAGLLLFLSVSVIYDVFVCLNEQQLIKNRGIFSADKKEILL